jgi:hypothetical protein
VSRGASACSFAAGWLLAGMTAWPIGWLSLIGAGFVRAGRAGQGPGGARPRSGAAGVLDASAGEPIIAGAGERPRACARAMRLCAPHRRRCGVAGLLAAFIPSGVPRPGWPGGMGRFASRGGRGQSRFRSRRRVRHLVPDPAGNTRLRGRAPVRGRQLTLPGWWRGGGTRRAWHRTPGSAGSGRQRSWRCRGHRRRGGRGSRP